MSRSFEKLKNSDHSVNTNASKHQSRKPLEHEGQKQQQFSRWRHFRSKNDDSHGGGDLLRKAMTLIRRRLFGSDVFGIALAPCLKVG